MPMKLLIVESPSKAKTIEKYLEGAYTVRASIGHVRDLPKSNKDAIDIPGGFVPRYVVSAGKEKVISEIQSLAEKADEVLLATDPDREGEAIAWHLEQLIRDDFLKSKGALAKGTLIPSGQNTYASGKGASSDTYPEAKNKKTNKKSKANDKIKRVSYHEITKEAILEALEHPREI